MAPRRASRSVVVRRYVAVGELAQKRAAVLALRREKQRLEHRLGASTSLDTIAREARALGYVKSGEHLFIKGVNEWRKRERAELRGRGIVLRLSRRPSRPFARSSRSGSRSC